MFRLSISERTSSVETAADVRSLRTTRLIHSVLGLFLLLVSARFGLAETHVPVAGHGAPTPGGKEKLAESYGKVPLSFEPNRGQTSNEVQWVARGPEYALFLSGPDAVLQLNSVAPAKGITDKPKIESAAMRMNLLGAKAVKNAEGEEQLPGKANYFTGRDASKWLSEVPTFGKVRLREVYPGIDLVYYGRQGRLEYDFVVSPGADPAKIGLQFDGAKAGLAANGDLVLPIKGGSGTKEIRFDKPTVYQMKDGIRQPVAGAFYVGSDGKVSFSLGEYDRRRELVIDPTLVFDGQIGTGNQQTIPTSMAVDSLGEMVITGYTNDLTFPVTTGAYQTNCQVPTSNGEGSSRCGASSVPSAFVTKLSADGGSLIYSTYLHGGGGYEQGQSVAVDAAGDAYVLGSTSSNDFPITSNAYQTYCQPTHPFIGFNYPEYGPSVSSQCDNFYDGGGTEYTVNGPNLFIAKLNPLGTALLYSTFFGGSQGAYPVGLALDSANNIYFMSNVIGLSADNLYVNNQNSSQVQFPVTASAYQSVGINVNESAVSELSADGQTLLYSTFLGAISGGSGHNVNGQAFAVGPNGIAYAGGYTQASNFPTTSGSLKPTCTVSANDNSYCQTNMGFVAAIDTTKSGAASLVYGSYLGGETTQGSNIPEQEVYGLAADANNDLFVTGYTYAGNFPTTAGAFQTTCAGGSANCPETAFLSKINPSGSALTWSTFVGGTSTGPAPSYGASVALDSAGKVYLYGFSQDGGGDFPQVNPLQPYTGGNKVFVTEFTPDAKTLLFGTRFGTSSTTAGSSATPIANGLALDAAGNMYITGYTNDDGTFGATPGAYSTPATNGFNRTFFAKISPATPPTPSNGLTTNLLLNPGAELGSIADWTPGGGGTPVVDSGTFDPGINPHTGSYDFVGGTNTPTDSLSQTVSIITQGITAAQVDGGTLFANVSFWEQGLNQGDPSDEGSVTLTFLDASNATISTVTIGPEDSHDGNWFNVTGIYAIPSGTRSITYTMNFIKNQLADDDAFIDDNVLSIHTDTGLTVSPAKLHFGNVMVGQQSAAQTATLTNQQPSMTTINIQQILSELGANPSDFLETDNCPSNGALAAGASCTLTITFVPDGVGPKSAGIAINTDSVPALQEVAVDGTGTGGILQVNPGNLKTIAGNGTAGTTGNGGLATAAELNQPNGVAFDPSGNLYIADDQANVIRKVDTTGKITTFAGIGTGGFAGDGGLATQAELLIPFSVASDKNGNIYIQDTGNYVIRKVDAKTGIITTVAGTPGIPGRSGDGGPATAAKLNENQGARFDSAGNFYLALCPTGTIRKIDTTGVITTVAGTPGSSGFSGDGGPATAAQLQCPSGVTIDKAGNFYIADEFNQVIRKVNTQGVISTIAGTAGMAGFSGDGGAATSATFNNPNDVVIDAAGNLYVADSGNNRVRKIDTNGVITSAAGGLNNAGSAAVNTPLAVTVDTAGDVYFSDSGNSKIEEIFPQGVQPFPATTVGSTAPAQTQTLSNIGNVDVTLAANGAFTTSGNAGDFALSAGTCTGGAVLTANGGSCALSLTFTPTAVGQRTLTVAIADNALNSPQTFSIGGTGMAAVVQQTPVITWATPAPIDTATPLSVVQLDATAADASGAALPGTFAYTPAAGTTLATGTQTLSVTFTPTDTTAFTTATKTVQIVVTQVNRGTATATSLTVTSGGTAVGAVTAGSVVTLKAAVTAGTAPVSPAQVAFCDATALSCTGLHRLAIAQVTSGGLASFSFVPGIGPHHYIAIFEGTNLDAASSSSPASLVVTGMYPSATTIAQSGAAGNFTLTATTVGAGAAPHLTQADIQSVTINLGQSAQNYVLAGTGPSTSNGFTYGNYYNVQGSCVTSASSTTCDLTGPFTSTTAGLAAGTYDFQTVFSGSISSSTTSQTYYAVGTTEPNGFIYTSLAPSTNMTLKLNVTGGGSYSIPVVQNGNFVESLDDLSFANTSAVCGGTSLGNDPCQEDYVGTVVGATYSGPVTGAVQFEMPLFLSLAGPTGKASFLDTSNANAVLGTAALGTSTAGFAEVPSKTSPLTAGSGPSGETTGDFNGDGIQDFAVNLSDAGGVDIFLGNGDGTFQPGDYFEVGSLPAGVVAADLNGDGKLDLIVANTGDNTLSVLLGKGDGTFQHQVTYQCGSPVGLIVMDINHDGIPDVVAGDKTSNTISVLLGNGDGTLKTAVTYPAGTTPQSVAEGDFDGDGNVDVVVGNAGGASVGIFLGNGDGTFKTMVTYAVGSGPQGVQVGDFNGDGKLDLAVSNHDDRNVGVLLGNGDGTFGPQVTYLVGSQPVALAVADFNGDGILDITVGSTGNQTQDVLLGKGDGTFQTQLTYPTGNFPNGVAVADFNGDGLPDISVSNFTDGTVTIFLSQVTLTATAMVTGIAPTAGTHAVVASYPGDAYFATSVSQPTNVVVGGTSTTITWTPAVGTIVYGTALGASQLNATAATAAGVAIPGTFTYTPAAGTVLAAGTQTLKVTFTPTSANFSVATGSATITVTQATPAITWAAPASILYGSALSATQLDASATGVNGVALAGTFVYTPAAGTVLSAGTQTLSVAFTPTNANYTAATGTVKLVVTQLAATVAWTPPANIVYGTALSATQLDATATGLNAAALAGMFVYTPAAGTVLDAGTQTLSVTFTPTNANYAATTTTVKLVVTQAAATVAWKAPANIVYGTALSATQLDATATGVGGAVLAGAFVYTPPSGTVLTVGTQTLKVAFTPTSTNYTAATGSVTITVTQATPVITWATPAGIVYGTPLSPTQLDATVAGVSAGALAGTLVYTPALGTVLTPGTQTLNAAFTPTDAVDYTAASASVQIVVGGPTLTSFTPAQAVMGAASTTITLTGTGFVATSAVQANGTALATTYVNPTMLTAVIPATLLAKASTLQVAVSDPSIEATTPALAFTVLPIATSATLSGPPMTPPGSQPSVTLAITNPYPLPITAQFSLTFASLGSASIDDPAVQFSNGLRTFSYVVAANSTTVPPVELQAGTDAGTITIAVKLLADDLDVTPTTLAPLVIVVPPVVPVISGTTVTRSGDTLTVVIHGFSNTREVSSAVFDFTAATGDTLATPMVTVPATTIFGDWFSDTASYQYGSTFTYTQIFNTSGDASTVGQVKVTLTNSVGVSTVSTSP